MASRDIKAGEEIYAYYGYKPGREFPNDFPWYFELKAKIEKEGRLKTKNIECSKIITKQNVNNSNDLSILYNFY